MTTKAIDYLEERHPEIKGRIKKGEWVTVDVGQTYPINRLHVKGVRWESRMPARIVKGLPTIKTRTIE